MVACLRVATGWCLSSTIQEFENHSDPEGGLHDIQFIENFKYNYYN
jgi:hypothetical protein